MSENNRLPSKETIAKTCLHQQRSVAKSNHPLPGCLSANGFKDINERVNVEQDLESVICRMKELNSRTQEMERNYQAAFSEILQLLTSN